MTDYIKYYAHVTYLAYTAKNDQVVEIVDENRIEQCFAANIVHSCQQYIEQYCYTRFRLNNIVQYC